MTENSSPQNDEETGPQNDEETEMKDLQIDL
eukprot:CAMPEP_0176363592 /NCGR_PEP_ID=MMETSP0126-20121128/19218_1 /TAXON_ID=141414 ORGANISM="Strombidinopsis acuminatum, Strain SPMC142" /NCGR_SAMPLE_ID=MMETSP0126 /ASSEMBLY_ACC=CAM_ASM_000229 /LENGTH=30 /DNA_ID= /DNA_START= /DNA_END= /DNA_ORIENTATION=